LCESKLKRVAGMTATRLEVLIRKVESMQKELGISMPNKKGKPAKVSQPHC
jgi:hypothetical protein